MTIAEIHGKLRPYENLEDLLTSDVFGTFKYLHPNEALVPFFERAVCFNDFSLPKFLNDIVSAMYFFWPKSMDFLEPDLIIILTREDGSKLGINVECKYHAEKHNMEVDNLNEPESPRITGDQLVDQYLQLKKCRYKGELGDNLRNTGEKYLFYVTAHYAPPIEHIDETIQRLKEDPDDQKNFYWVSWREIMNLNLRNIKEELKCQMMKDLKLLLIRKRLTFLDIFKEPLKIKKEIRYFWKSSKKFWNFDITTSETGCSQREFFWNHRKAWFKFSLPSFNQRVFFFKGG